MGYICGIPIFLGAQGCISVKSRVENNVFCPAGLEEEFLFVGRLDNLAMSYLSLRALIDTVGGASALDDETAIKAVALFDHEEVGSASAQGVPQSSWSCNQTPSRSALLSVDSPSGYSLDRGEVPSEVGGVPV